MRTERWTAFWIGSLWKGLMKNSSKKRLTHFELTWQDLSGSQSIHNVDDSYWAATSEVTHGSCFIDMAVDVASNLSTDKTCWCGNWFGAVDVAPWWHGRLTNSMRSNARGRLWLVNPVYVCWFTCAVRTRSNRIRFHELDLNSMDMSLGVFHAQFILLRVKTLPRTAYSRSW